MRAATGWGWGAAGGRKEQTGREERVLVQGTLRNCEESGREQRPLGTTSRSERTRSLPGWPRAPEHAAKWLYSELSHGPLGPLSPSAGLARDGQLRLQHSRKGIPVPGSLVQKRCSKSCYPCPPPSQAPQVLLTATGQRGCAPIRWARNGLPGPHDATVGSHRTQLVRSRGALSRREQGHPGKLTCVILS